MTKLHEILAVEKTRTAASKDSIGETKKKFANHSQFFSGRCRTLTMFSDSPENAALQAAESSQQLPTTDVVSTLAYTLALWAQAQNIRATKDLTNTVASADVMLKGEVFLTAVPADTLMGLISQAKELKEMLVLAPTLDPTKKWAKNPAGFYMSPVVTSVKSKKEEYGLELSPATEKHPAQVKPSTREVPVGKFEDQVFSTLWTTNQKAAALMWIDELTSELQAALQRANQVDIKTSNVGLSVMDALLRAIRDAEKSDQ